MGLGLQPRFELGCSRGFTREDDVAALEERLHVFASNHGEHVAEVGHGDFPATADIDRAKKRDAGVDC
jgi:hypothetical protein